MHASRLNDNRTGAVWSNSKCSRAAKAVKRRSRRQRKSSGIVELFSTTAARAFEAACQRLIGRAPPPRSWVACQQSKGALKRGLSVRARAGVLRLRFGLSGSFAMPFGAPLRIGPLSAGAAGERGRPWGTPSGAPFHCRSTQSSRVLSSPASSSNRFQLSSWLVPSEACSLSFPFALSAAQRIPDSQTVFFSPHLTLLSSLCALPCRCLSLFLRLLAALPQAGGLALGPLRLRYSPRTYRQADQGSATAVRFLYPKPFLASTPRQSFEIQTSYRPSNSTTPQLPSDNQPTVHCYTKAITPLLPTLPTLRARHPVQHRHRLSRPIRPSEPPHRFRQFVSSIAPRKATTRPTLAVAHQSSATHSSPTISTAPLSLILEVSQFCVA